MNKTELLNLLRGAFATLDEAEVQIRTSFAKARDWIHERIIETAGQERPTGGYEPMEALSARVASDGARK
jgi:hypothetical protein